MGQLFNNILHVWGQKIPEANTFIGGAGLDYPTIIALADAMQIPAVSIQNFRVDSEGNISCRIDIPYTLGSAAFSSYHNHNSSFRQYYVDVDGNMIGGQYRSMASSEGLRLRLPNFTNWGTQFNGHTALGVLFGYFPELIHNGNPNNNYFHDWRNGFNRLYIPKLVLPSGFDGSQLFTNYQLNNNATYANTVYVHPDIATFPRIVTLQNKSGVKLQVRVVNDFTLPEIVNDLSVSNITDTTVTVDFTEVSAFNGLDYYEVWLEEVNNFLPLNRYFPKIQEVKNTGDIITGLKPQTTYSLRLCSVDMKYNGTGMDRNPSRRCFSNNVIFTTL